MMQKTQFDELPIEKISTANEFSTPILVKEIKSVVLWIIASRLNIEKNLAQKDFCGIFGPSGFRWKGEKQ